MTLAEFFNKKAPIHIRMIRTAGLVAALGFGTQLAVENLPEQDYTDDQKDMLHSMFKDSLDIEAISYKKSAISDWFNKVNGSDAFALGNTIHMHSRYNEDDKFIGKWIFRHENAHVWQNQNCGIEVPNIFVAAFEGAFMKPSKDLPYHYTLTADKDLSDYNVEQQASMIADYFRVLEDKHPLYLSYNQSFKEGQSIRAHYEPVLANFLKDPSYIKNHCQNILRH